MITAVFVFNIPAGVSEAEFEAWYLGRHVPDLQRVEGLRGYVYGGRAAGFEGAMDCQRLAQFTFDSLEAMNAAMASPDWQAAAADAGPWIADPRVFVFDSARAV